MSNDLYNDGYNYFIEHGAQSVEFIKKQPYLFRSGYNRAVEDSINTNTGQLVNLNLQQVDRTIVKYEFNRFDVDDILQRKRYKVLLKEEMKPLTDMLINAVCNKSESYKSYGDVVKMVNKMFNIILQYGYDLKVLDDDDLKYHDYKPTIRW